MRPVNKGDSPRDYIDYGQARHDLAERIGYYCSYCEMKVYQGIEVEHILPVNQGGDELEWDNFLLSCKYCNTRKSDHNDNLSDYVWPDIDNTDLVFEYSEASVVTPQKGLSLELNQKAQQTIDLMKLDLFADNTTEADTRWRSRKEAWDLARKSYNSWDEAPIVEMARVIARTSLSGHYSIWMTVFRDVPEVLKEIDEVYRCKGLYKEYDEDGNRIVRPGGCI
ncbi:HNH endonuclease [Puteibacter caeruleilacunae]|nr:HNH endonuclease [Puteibacter caeruleilacunae]